MGQSSEDRLPAGLWGIAAVAILGSFLAQLDATVVNVSLSSLATDLHAPLAEIQWVTSGYLLALALMLPLNSWLVDRVGTRNLYLGCFIAFSLASALCGVAWSPGSLIGFRVLQGMSGGLLAPMAQLTLARAAGKHMAKVFGYAALPILLGPVVGPVLAGAILSHASWRWLFLINVPVGTIALLLAWKVLPKDGAAEERRALDLRGLLLLSPALVLLLYAADHVRERSGWWLMAASFALLSLFLLHARRLQERALIDLKLFRGAFSISVATQFMSNGIAFAGQFLVPYFLVKVYATSPSKTGWLMAPLGLGMMCVYPTMGAMTKRFGVRQVAGVGASVALLGSLPFLWLATHGLSVPVLELSLFIRGMGMSSVGIPSITSAYAAVEKRSLPMATTALNIVQRLGGPIWTTVVATFLAWSWSGRASVLQQPKPLFAMAFGLLIVMHALQLFFALQLPRAMPEQPKAEELRREELEAVES
ncbi:MAG: DHA2 family efflux MFS transporter permease subunit [Acidobacteriaceae bacterium]|nr:DHA2 family efflux MFS transporter permease subunit [Acidobacteriaceae bacterium]